MRHMQARNARADTSEPAVPFQICHPPGWYCLEPLERIQAHFRRKGKSCLMGPDSSTRVVPKYYICVVEGPLADELPSTILVNTKNMNPACNRNSMSCMSILNMVLRKLRHWRLLTCCGRLEAFSETGGPPEVPWWPWLPRCAPAFIAGRCIRLVSGSHEA